MTADGWLYGLGRYHAPDALRGHTGAHVWPVRGCHGAWMAHEKVTLYGSCATSAGLSGVVFGATCQVCADAALAQSSEIMTRMVLINDR